MLFLTSVTADLRRSGFLAFFSRWVFAEKTRFFVFFFSAAALLNTVSAPTD